MLYIGDQGVMRAYSSANAAPRVPRPLETVNAIVKMLTQQTWILL